MEGGGVRRRGKGEGARSKGGFVVGGWVGGGGGGRGVIARTRAVDVSGCHMLRAVVSAALLFPSARAMRACITLSWPSHGV